jgi:ATP/ADP translocase
MDASSVANAKQHQTVAMRTLGHVVLAPIALIMIVLGGVVLFSIVAVAEPVKWQMTGE